MIDKKSILKMAEHVFRRSQGVPDKRLMHPVREWRVGLILFAVVLIGGSILSGLTFVKYQQSDTAVGEPGERVPTYKESVVLSAIEVYRERESEFRTKSEQNRFILPVLEDASSTASSTDSDLEDEATETGEALETGDGSAVEEDTTPEVPILE